jgi:two-component system, NtrC family, sensor kinase
VRLFRCDLAFFLRRNGNTFSQAALVGSDGSHIPLDPAALPIDPEINFPSRTIVSKKNLHLPDWSAIDLPEHERRIHETYGINSSLFLPLVLRGGECFGLLALASKRPRIFGESEISLAESFRDQAVIAIENARLFNETKESLERQTATAEVLQVINSSPGELAPVFQTILEKAHSLCGVSHGSLQLYDGEKFRAVAVHGIRETFADRLREGFVPGPNHPCQPLLGGMRFAQVPDCAEIDDPIVRAAFELSGIRTVLFIPLLKERELLGQIVAARPEVRSFTDKEIALLENFAAQAVIAMENARLLGELRQRTNDLTEAMTYQTGSSNILNVIASSPTDVAPVLKAIVESACELCSAYDAVVILKQDDDLRLGAHHGPISMIQKRWKDDRTSVSGRAMADRRPVHVHDVLSDEGVEFAIAREMSRLDGCHTLLAVPLLRDRDAVGAIVLRRAEVDPFSEKQIALLQTFADQAVIAIGNVRLFDEVQARTRELAASLDELRAAQDRLVQTEKLASLGQLTAGIAHEIKNPLNFVNNFSALSAELIDELDETLAPAPLDQKMRTEVNELTQILKANLEKVVQHGKRADSIVKNMLQHSREGSGDHRSADINAIVEDSLNLAYHGARAEKSDFTITLQYDLDPQAGAAELYPQEITRALLNLISNGFYAATKRKAESDDDSFEPVLRASTKNLGTTVEIRIRDNGAGIPAAIKEKMFVPFFTTKPTGEGTGLGLSITHDIIVKQHGGRIDVETEPGTFTEFIVTLPRGNRTSGG